MSTEARMFICSTFSQILTPPLPQLLTFETDFSSSSANYNVVISSELCLVKGCPEWVFSKNKQIKNLSSSILKIRSSEINLQRSAWKLLLRSAKNEIVLFILD